MMCQRIGRPATSIIGFGRYSVCSRKRVPLPPHRITTGVSSDIVIPLVENLVVHRLEVPAVRVDGVFVVHLPAAGLAEGAAEVGIASQAQQMPGQAGDVALVGEEAGHAVVDLL